jgi:hypothetical protein
MTGNPLRRLLAVFLLAGMALAMGATRAGAAESAAGSSWQYTADVYLFAAGIGGETSTGGDVDIGFDTLIRNLDMALMGGFGARKGKWSLMADVIYLDVSADNSGQLTIPLGRRGIDVATSSSVEMKGWVVTPHVGYTLIDTANGSLDAFAGVRYLYLKANLALTTVGPITTRYDQIADSGTVWDGIVGVRGRVNLAPKWFVPYYADVGTGESKLTWQLFSGVGYRFKSFDAFVGYRYLDWKFKNGAPVFEDLNFSGPIVGVKFDF